MTAPRSILARTCRALNQRGVRYVVVGERAAQLAGHRCATLDMDFLLAPDRQNIERALDALAGSGLPPDARWLAAALHGRAVLVLGRAPAISLVMAAGASGFEGVWAEAAEVRLEGVPIPMAPEWTG